MKRLISIFLTLAVCLCFLLGCVKTALRFSGSAIPHFMQSFFEECDPNLAEESLPAQLKLMEGLLKNDPENEQLLTALCAGFTGYALLFVEEKDSERASKLYQRGLFYGIKALGEKSSFLEGQSDGDVEFRGRLKAFREKDMAPLFWLTVSWNAWINLNLDQPAALAQLGQAQICLERILEINPDYFFGTPYALMGLSLSAKPGIFGGDSERSREYFEKAVAVSKGSFFLAPYFFARYYAVRVQDKALFFKLLEEVEKAPAHNLKEACLMNVVFKEKAKRLKGLSEDLFL